MKTLRLDPRNTELDIYIGGKKPFCIIKNEHPVVLTVVKRDGNIVNIVESKACAYTKDDDDNDVINDCDEYVILEKIQNLQLLEIRYFLKPLF